MNAGGTFFGPPVFFEKFEIIYYLWEVLFLNK